MEEKQRRCQEPCPWVRTLLRCVPGEARGIVERALREGRGPGDLTAEEIKALLPPRRKR